MKDRKKFIKLFTKLATMKNSEKSVLENGNQEDIDKFYADLENVKIEVENMSGVTYGNLVRVTR